jgi:hypothetical protein
MKNISLSLLILTLFASCSSRVKKDPRWDTAKVTIIEDGGKYDLADLKQEKKRIDKLAADTSKLIVLAKIPGKDTPVKVVNDKYPDEVETTYNLLMDDNGNIIYTVEIPFSDSGDWDISYKSYFDKNGRLFAFEREAGFFNSQCTKNDVGAAHEKLTRYYNGSQPVDSIYQLVGDDKKPLIKSKCTFYYNFPYKVITNINLFLYQKRISHI